MPINQEQPALVALDWGTSSLRAWLLSRHGAILDARAEPLGILKVAGGAFDATFEAVCGRWFEAHGPLPALASGMIGSRQGWREAPYVRCPAGEREIAEGLLRFRSAAGRDVSIVPGVLREGDVPDVMRGEETQILGAGGADGVFVLPGTHSKWVMASRGRIEWFATYMTGELFASLCEHTILGRLIRGEAADAIAFARGVNFGLAGEAGGLAAKLFSVRTLGLFDRIAGEALRDYLSGLLIGDEIREAMHVIASAQRVEPARVRLIGDAALTPRYRDALSRAGIAAVIEGESITPRGLARIARAAGLV